MKHKSPSITKLIQKVSYVVDILENLRAFIEDAKDREFSVTFYHGADRELLAISWSDRYDNPIPDNFIFEYTYKISSNGIHFTGFSERGEGDKWFASKRYWYSSGESKECTLLNVPNLGPSGYKSMYLFHQEKIRETLSALPAWAIVVGTDY